MDGSPSDLRLRHHCKPFGTGRGRQPVLAMPGMRLAAGILAWEVQDTRSLFTNRTAVSALTTASPNPPQPVIL